MTKAINQETQPFIEVYQYQSKNDEDSVKTIKPSLSLK